MTGEGAVLDRPEVSSVTLQRVPIEGKSIVAGPTVTVVQKLHPGFHIVQLFTHIIWRIDPFVHVPVLIVAKINKTCEGDDYLRLKNICVLSYAFDDLMSRRHVFRIRISYPTCDRELGQKDIYRPYDSAYCLGCEMTQD